MTRIQVHILDCARQGIAVPSVFAVDAVTLEKEGYILPAPDSKQPRLSRAGCVFTLTYHGWEILENVVGRVFFFATPFQAYH